MVPTMAPQLVVDGYPSGGSTTAETEPLRFQGYHSPRVCNNVIACICGALRPRNILLAVLDKRIRSIQFF